MTTEMKFCIKEISFEDILAFWQNNLWPYRTSPIQTHSSMTWPLTSVKEYDMNIYNYPATYFGMYQDNKIVGVNSGHKTSNNEYRSRGLWVNNSYRGKRLGQRLLEAIIKQAALESCTMIWSLPRLSALKTYKNVGFTEQGNPFETETSEANVYVSKLIV